MNLEKFKEAALNAQEMKAVNGGDLWDLTVGYYTATVYVAKKVVKAISDVAILHADHP